MNAPAIERGWTVYTEDNKRVGDVVEVHGHYMLVSRGLLVVRDIYVPRYAVASVEERKVRLSITDERIRRMDWTAPPPPPPLRPDSTDPMIVPSPASSTLPDREADDGTTTMMDTLPISTPEEQTASPFGDVFAPDYNDGFDGATFQPDLDDYEDMGILLGNQVEVDGEAYLTVQQIGSGPAVVFVHGWGFDRRVWEYLTLDLPRDVTMVTYDGRGYGRSSAPWWGYDVARASRDLRVLLRTLDLRDATLVGIDTGAAAALHYIQHGGRRAGRLVLIAPALPPAPSMPPEEPTVVPEADMTPLAEAGTTPLAEAGTTPPAESDAEMTATPLARGADRIPTGAIVPGTDVAAPDGSQSMDAGTPEDADTPEDAGTPEDADTPEDAGTPEDGAETTDGDEDPAAPYAVEILPEPLRTWARDLQRDRPLLATHLAALWAPTASPETQEWLREGFMAAAPYALLHGLDTLALADYSLSFAGVEAPILVLHGADDPVAPLARVQAALEAAENPKARLVILDTPSHLPMLTDPERVAEEIREVISG